MTVNSALRSRQSSCVRALRHGVPAGCATECRPILLIIARKLVSWGWSEECAWLDKPTAIRVVKSYSTPESFADLQKELEVFLCPVLEQEVVPSSSSTARGSTDPAPLTPPPLRLPQSPPPALASVPFWRLRHRASDIFATQLKADQTALAEKAAVIQRNWRPLRLRILKGTVAWWLSLQNLQHTGNSETCSLRR